MMLKCLWKSMVTSDKNIFLLLKIMQYLLGLYELSNRVKFLNHRHQYNLHFHNVHNGIRPTVDHGRGD